MLRDILQAEMKHGPIALIDKKMPVVILAPNDAFFQKNSIIQK